MPILVSRKPSVGTMTKRITEINRVKLGLKGGLSGKVGQVSNFKPRKRKRG